MFVKHDLHMQGKYRELYVKSFNLGPLYVVGQTQGRGGKQIERIHDV